jgi:hypothetical protein
MTPTMMAVKMLFADSPHFFTTAMFVQDARAFIEKWASGETGKEKGSCQVTSMPWVVDLSKVIMIHGIDLETLRVAKQAQDMQVAQAKNQMQGGGEVGPGASFWPGSSGVKQK